MSSSYSLRSAFLSFFTTMTSILSWLFSVKDVPKLIYPATVASLKIRTTSRPKDVTEISLEDLVEKRCPSLHSTFRPAWWLPKYD